MLLAFADDDRAIHPDHIENFPHLIYRSLVSGILVTLPLPFSRSQSRGFGFSDDLQRQFR